MFDSLLDGLLLVLQWKAFLYLIIGAFIGYWVGILPGIGGATTLALMMPFIYKMTPAEAFPFLIGRHSARCRILRKILPFSICRFRRLLLAGIYSRFKCNHFTLLLSACG